MTMIVCQPAGGLLHGITTTVGVNITAATEGK